MPHRFAERISSELRIGRDQVLSVSDLLAEGATVPFIARYRKERTGGLDEVKIIAVRDLMERLEEVEKRRDAILKSLRDRDLLTDALLEKVGNAPTLSTLEDVYLPYRPKRRTRGGIAREKGLEPLARMLFRQGREDPVAEAQAFVDAGKGVSDAEAALAGARDIIAEWINEDGDTRAEMRKLFARRAILRSKAVKGKEEEGAKFKTYHDWEEPLHKAPSHRILAVFRGAKDGFLRIHVRPDESEAVQWLEHRFVKSRGNASKQVSLAARDAYKRLLSVSMETQARAEAKQRADEEAIRVFAENLRHLLLAPPLGRKRVLALDPGFRTGCKLVCLDATGKLLHHDVIHPLPPHNKTAEAGSKIHDLVDRYGIETIALGHGTGGREARRFCKGLSFTEPIPVVMVNESGASVYSASNAGREEFPDHDATVRGAVSIGRRLMDPLAELVKIDPKSIGVGQYQHDVSQKELKKALDDCVEGVVNAVGVELNTASKPLLKYVSGLSEKLAGNLVAYRNEHGPFPSRTALKKVPGLGPKAFEQSAGFLRVTGSKNPLDGTAVHPESYPIVKKMAGDLDGSVTDLIRDPALRARIRPEQYVTDTAGLPTLKDILEALGKAGRDPREPFDPFSFHQDVLEMSDLKVGMELPGVVTNVTAFGAFVDIGVHHDGLVHISRMGERFVKSPHDVVHVGKNVRVRVIDIDIDRKRIGLSMRRMDAARRSDEG
ncbi:MAG: Tex family protein [Planctomycetota bacterium]